jgi:hypothetical protein
MPNHHFHQMPRPDARYDAAATRVDSSGFWHQLGEASSQLRSTDILVFALILGLGALQFFWSERASDFPGDDVFFADAARSIVTHGFYGINGQPETNMPPGLSWILALLCFAGRCTHAVCLHAMAIFATLGFLASYELLRRQAPRIVAAAICLLLISSRIHFSFVTQLVFPCYPYFFATMSALLVAVKFEEAPRLGSRIGWGALLTALVAASVMFASAGIAFLGSMVASICLMFLRDRHSALARLKMYVGILIFGATVQGFWMHYGKDVEASAGIAASEWPVPGFPHSYLAQLKVKSGNDPELGMATSRDVGVRILANVYHHAYFLSQMLLQRSSYITFMSILVLGPLVLIALGWCSSIWRNEGGLLEWYFAGYELIYILWPWTLETRFLLPVAPLACLYMWRGGEAVVLLAKDKPRLLGIVWLPASVLLAAGSWAWMHGARFASNLSDGGFQDKASFLVWVLSAILAAWMIWQGRGWLISTNAVLRWCFRPIGVLRIDPLRAPKLLGLAILACLIVGRLTTQLEIGRSNLDLSSATNRLSADAEAGAWVRSHTDPNVVVMARHVPTAYHYSERKVVWFPPSSNPQVLMEGILRHQVDFVIVVRRGDLSYYLPPDDDCFAALLAAYPDAFRLVYRVPDFRIFQVTKNAASAPAQSNFSRTELPVRSND